MSKKDMTIQPITASARHYDNATIFFHWATAVLVVTQWLGAQTIDWFPRGPLRVDARSVHITFGALLAVILAGRVIWRLTGGRRLPLADRGALNVVAKGTHWGLYALLAAMVLVGMFLTWTRGDSIFNMFSLPAYDPANKGLPHQVQDIHATIGWIILALAGLHAAAALLHRYVWHDGVLGRMLPRG
jgi:cytochrome b561